ncbi:MAG: LON peptidase substrate-binding domain-containing protein [Anaerolineae bacterium]|nr:LON peptidase substrate-binding domain-containing protein [Anaerolineae bacterium]
MSDTYELPLFPLQTVLFPGMPLPLHIFEPRYKQMIGECVQQSRPFGVVLIEAGSEVGGGATIHKVGTSASIVQMRPLENGEMDILSTGQSRFIIEGTHTEKSYLTGIVRDYPLADTDDETIKPLAVLISSMVKQYLEIFATLGEVDVKLDTLPEDPQALAYLTAVVLHMPMQDKQKLLNMASLPSLLRREQRLLNREAQILKALITHGIRSRDDTSPFSMN